MSLKPLDDGKSRKKNSRANRGFDCGSWGHGCVAWALIARTGAPVGTISTAWAIIDLGTVFSVAMNATVNRGATSG